jgi:hypothetical protein
VTTPLNYETPPRKKKKRRRIGLLVTAGATVRRRIHETGRSATSVVIQPINFSR